MFYKGKQNLMMEKCFNSNVAADTPGSQTFKHKDNKPKTETSQYTRTYVST